MQTTRVSLCYGSNTCHDRGESFSLRARPMLSRFSQRHVFFLCNHPRGGGQRRLNPGVENEMHERRQSSKAKKHPKPSLGKPTSDPGARTSVKAGKRRRKKAQRSRRPPACNTPWCHGKCRLRKSSPLRQAPQVRQGKFDCDSGDHRTRAIIEDAGGE